MFSKILSSFIKGMEVLFINVEADVSDGLPVFDMVGFLSSEVKEARERVRTAFRNSGIKLPPRHITVNLSPANIRKYGTCFDLPIAVAVLKAMGLLPKEAFLDMLVLGELGLDGTLRGVRGILPVIAHAKAQGVKACLLPEENLKEAALVKGIDLYAASDLRDVINGFGTNNKMSPVHIDVAEDNCEVESDIPDFSEISGQDGAKRAAQIAAAGFHNLLLIGPPGAGKTLIARCLPGILPAMSHKESLEVTKIYSVAGLIEADNPLVKRRPFRSPHHTVSATAMSGGGIVPRPGEITLSHRGVLFLDELPEYKKSTLEVLRQPLEEGKIHISRVSGTYDYPADFILVAAMNPCKCGYFPDYNKCSCSTDEVRRYLGRISRPLLDRIDLCMEVQKVSFDALTDKKPAVSSAQMRYEVEQARARQQARYEGSGVSFNSQLLADQIKKYCGLGNDEQVFARFIYDKFSLTARGYHRLLKVARTIADLAGEEAIKKEHLSEAVLYRTMDRKFWTR